FHDIGKISIPAEILTKPTKLTAEEYEINKKHADIGSLFFSDHAYSLVADIIRHHHERYDGNGYPDKLKCNEISLAAKIVALADSYDTMTSSRRYSNTIKNKEEALKEIIFCSVETEFGGKGCQFDPLLAENFCNFLTSN
ncbi:MAG: HD domain-containing protein, partial [Bacilli bacterium]|nr:HD domain-containing protein [Bacilli bacterium]